MASCAPSSWFLYGERCCRDRRQQQQLLSSSGGGFLISSVSGGALGVSRSSGRGKKASRGEVKVGAFWQDVSRPTSPIQLEAIAGMEELDRLLEQAREMDQAVVIDWMAAWCRKCIYLKPKLEKLAAEFYPRVKFYCVDVNKVPQALVKRGNISKMPTIQLWKDGECKEEVIGGHKAWLVVEEVREMVQKYL